MEAGLSPSIGLPTTRNEAGNRLSPDADVPLPRVHAVVLNWCGEEDTAACLNSLILSDYPFLEILLVDNGSPDGSGARLHQQFPDVPYLSIAENIGYTGGNNIGIERVLDEGADYVLIVNNDTVIAPDCVTELVAAARSGIRVGGVAPKILYHDDVERIWFGGGTLSRLRAIGRHTALGDQDRPNGREEVESVSFLSGCCLLLPSDVIRETGAFAEDFFAYVEDVELSARLVAAGYSLLYQPRARLLHRVSLTSSEPSAMQIFLRDRNRRRFVRRNYGLADKAAFSIFFYPSRLVRLAGYLMRGDTQRASAILRGMTAR